MLLVTLKILFIRTKLMNLFDFQISIICRRVLDGRKGAKTVFNGLEPMTDLICTQSNRYISSNWDGFYDPDSGIRGYTLAAGRKVCDESLRNHHDPHNHLFHESEWTHSELIDVDDMNLPKLDGKLISSTFDY